MKNISYETMLITKWNENKELILNAEKHTRYYSISHIPISKPEYEISNKAFCTIICGLNGSGKTTLYPLFSLPGEFINADIIAKQINPNCPETVSLQAGRIALERIQKRTENHKSFVFETTLSSQQSLTLMKKCKEQGYEISLVYITLNDPELNIMRVAKRVQQGGHHIPDDIIRRRSKTITGHLPKALEIVDSYILLDNSGRNPVMIGYSNE